MSSVPPPSATGAGAGSQWAPPTGPPPPTYPVSQPGFGTCWPQVAAFQYAGFWNRVGARILDGLLGFAVMIPFLIVGIVLIANGVSDCSFRSDNPDCFHVDQPGLVVAGGSICTAGLVLWLILYIRWWGKGQTPGMKAAGTRLVREGTLQPIGPGRATGRYFAAILSGWILYLGYFWMLWDK